MTGYLPLLVGNLQAGYKRFSDWENAVKRISHHENSKKQQSFFKSLKDKTNALGRVDKILTAKYNKEVAYWKIVLRRVVAVIRSLTARDCILEGMAKSLVLFTTETLLLKQLINV